MTTETDSNELSKKIHKIIESRMENDKDTLDAFTELSTFYTENTPCARRNLRSQIEKRKISISEEYLNSFRKVKETYDALFDDITAMNTSVKDMTKCLQKIKVQNSSLIKQTKSLHEQSIKVELQKEVAQTLTEKFQLTLEEKAALHGENRMAPVTSDIFVSLDRIQQIQSDCRKLMQSGCQVLATDILEQMNIHQENALERLYRWTQSHCRNIDSPTVSTLISEAMARIQEKPVLFSHVMEEYCTARRSILVRAFIDALTKGGPDGNPPAMEMHAHDPQRYVGDMLAWLNQAIPTEKENLLVLVKNCNKVDVSEHISRALANISEGVCHPLKARVEKILTVPAPSTTLYAVTILIRFYQNTISQVAKGGMLETVLRELHDSCEFAFLNALQAQVVAALTRVESPPRDLSPTPAISHMLVMLREVLSTASMVEGREKDMRKIVSCVLEPLLRAVNEQASRLPTADMSVYLLNCTHAMHSSLALFPHMEERLERLQATGDAQLDTLTSEQASSLVANLSLGPVYTILQGQDKGPLSTITGMEPLILKSLVDKFERFVEMPDTMLLPQILLLTSSVHRNTVKKRAFDVLIAIYKQLYEAVYDPNNLYQNPSAILSQTPDEISKKLNL